MIDVEFFLLLLGCRFILLDTVGRNRFRDMTDNVERFPARPHSRNLTKRHTYFGKGFFGQADNLSDSHLLIDWMYNVEQNAATLIDRSICKHVDKTDR